MFSDYYADLPGGKPAGRSIEPVPFDSRSELGDWFAGAHHAAHGVADDGRGHALSTGLENP